MAYPKHWLLQFGGTVGDPAVEIWSCGIRMGAFTSDPLDSEVDEDEYVAGIGKDALAAWMTRATSKIHSRVKLGFVKLNEIGPEGRYVDQTTHEYYFPTPVAGGGGTTGLPYQCSVAITWGSNDVSRGPASTGRIFSPGPSVAVVSATGLFPTADAVGMATSAEALLDSLDFGLGLVGGSFRGALVSPVNEGSIRQIQTVSVDNRVDIQRRRANSLAPVRSTVQVEY